METTYWTECDICDNIVEVTVLDGDDKPELCPMCGESTTYKETED